MVPLCKKKEKNQENRNAVAREWGLRTHQPAKRARCRSTRAPKIGRNESESGTPRHDRMQGEYRDNMPSSSVYGTRASTNPAQERASADIMAANLLQNGIELPTIRATTDAPDGVDAVRVVPAGISTIDQFGQTAASLNDEVGRFLMLLHRQHKYPPLHADIVSAFDSINELIRHAVDSFVENDWISVQC